MAESAVRLPGILFDAVPDAATPALPRMDVAAFAGFARRGPVGVPVALDDVATFDAIFGGDLSLAWDPVEGQMARALLRPAVREFFRNGGRRCWVVRLAAATAQPARFPLPGVLRQDAGGGLHPAVAEATSPGSWADAVRVHAGSLRMGVPASGLTMVEAPAPDAGVRLMEPARRELLRLELPDGSFGYLPPAIAPRATPLAADLLDSGDDGGWRPARLSTWFRPALPGALPRRAGARLFRVDGDGPAELSIMSWSTGQEAVFQVPVEQAAALRSGAWLRLDQAPLAGSQFEADSWLLVDDVDPAGSRATIRARHGWRRLVRATAWQRATHVQPRALLLSVELRAEVAAAGGTFRAELPLVGGPAARAVAFPSDAARYAAPGPGLDGSDAQDLPSPRARLAFPLAWGEAVDEVALLPLGLERVLPDAYDQAAVSAAGTALERDGLHELTASLFLDADLADVPVARLADAAFDLEHGARADARSPSGIHALMGVEEASMLAVPDAVQAGWTRVPGGAALPPAPPAAPVILAVRQPDAGGLVTMSWRAVTGAESYVAELAADPRFAGRPSRWAGPATGASLAVPAGCRDRLHVRVRALGAGGSGTWSRTRLLGLPPGSYETCGREPLPAPSLRPPEAAAGRIRLVWSGPGESFVLEQSAEPGFAEAAVVYEGGMRRAEVLRPTAAAWFRVSAVQGDEVSPWSNTNGFLPEPADRWVMLPRRGSEAGADLASLEARVTAVHAALLRLCAARGDAMCVLALPRLYREDEALRHVARLTTLLGVTGPGGSDAAAATLSFGALYHPWLAVPDAASGGGAVLVPPDGAMCGVMAVRAARQGAWAAPANRVLADVVALRPALGEGAVLRTTGRRVNLVTQEPSGFMALSEETLSDVRDLTGIGVRRLLILLRRLAQREGNRYVFQPHSPAFRRLVHRQFDRLLGDLFLRGALAGSRPAEGYRVVTGDSINPPASVDQGRLVVELRVAPSRPLHFLTVRLVQSGAGITMETG